MPHRKDVEHRIVLQDGQVLQYRASSVGFDVSRPDALVVRSEWSETVFYWPFVAYYVSRFER